MEKLYLIDVSGWIYRSYFALPPMTNAAGQPTHALYGFVRSIHKLLKDFGPTHMAAVFDGPDGKKSRTDIYADYKIHRKPTPEDLPPQIEWAKEFCSLLGIAQISVPGVEADDAMGTIATNAAKKGAEVYLCTADKDMAQLVTNKVFMLNTHKDNLLIDGAKVEEIYGVRPDQIIDYLAIMGDASDNIPGLPGFGPKTASTLLQRFGTLDVILASPLEVPGKKKQETIMQQADLALLSRTLATIDVNLDCPTSSSFYIRHDPDIGKLKDFYAEMGFKSLLKELPQSKSKPTAYHLVDDEESLGHLVKQLYTAKEIAFDTETTDVRPMQAQLVGIGFSIKEGEAWYVPTNGQLGLDRVVATFKPLFEDQRLGFFAHNAKYDLHVLANYGISVANLTFDTMLASYLLNSHSRRHSLDILSLEMFGKVKRPIKDLIGTGKKAITMAEVPLDVVSDYCCEDVDYTLRLKNHFEPDLSQRSLEKIYYDLELPLLSVLIKMERRGIFLDQPLLATQGVKITAAIAQLEEQIYEQAEEEFTLNSPKQLSVILFEKLGIKGTKKTQTGYSTAADVLEELRHVHPIIELVLAYRTLEKLRSTYVETLPKEVNPTTNRIHCTFNQFVAATGRLSAQDPNLQNIPVRTEEGRQVRAAFRPQQEGWIFLSADYSQVELRLLAHLSKDPALITAFEKGEDIHASTAALIFNIPLEQVTKQLRYQAKAVNFGIIYGQQAFGLAREIGVSMKEAADFIKTYFERFPKVSQFVRDSVETAKREGKATTMMGRERLIPEITSTNGMQRSAAERLAVNTPLQGSAADLIKLAMLRTDKALDNSGLKTRMLLQIHDELLFELPKEEATATEALVREAMEDAIPLLVPLPVDVTIGNNWKEC